MSSRRRSDCGPLIWWRRSARYRRSAVPEYQTKRPYVSAVLARNEVDRDGPYNRRIFRRTSRGFYILNPEMQVRIGDEWVRIHDLLDPDVLFADSGWTLPPDMRRIIQGERERFRRTAMDVLGGENGSAQ